MQRSDGTITYNLAVVVDDVTMEISHVIRGDDHISNTPKQVVIYQALGAAVPEFLHMPLLFGTDKKKLSKRHGATKLEQLTAEGFLVEVVRNYLCFLSAEFDESMIAWTLDDLVQKFDVLKLGTSASIFDPEKLRWMNGRFIRQLGDVELGERLEEYLTRVGFYRDPAAVEELARSGPEALAAAVEGAESAHAPALPPDEEQEGLTRILAPLVREKMDVLADFIPMAGWFFRPLVFERGRGREAAGDAFGRRGAARGGRRPRRPRRVGRGAHRAAGAGSPAAARREAQGRLRGTAPGDERPERHAGPLRVALGAGPRRHRRAAHHGRRPALAAARSGRRPATPRRLSPRLSPRSCLLPP